MANNSIEYGRHTVRHTWEDRPLSHSTSRSDKRTTERRAVSIRARLSWKDQRGVGRFASVVTKDVSDCGVFVECQSSLSIPMYRLVQFQLEPGHRAATDLPESLRDGRILSAVYRVSHGNG